MKIGIYEKSLPNYNNWQQTFSSAKDAGFDFVDIAIDPSDELITRLDWSYTERALIRNASNTIGIPIFSIVLSAHRKYSFGSQFESIRRRATEIMEKAIDLSVNVGIRSIQLAGYFTYDEPGWDGAREKFLEGLIKAEELAAQAGVILGLENMNGTDVISISTAIEIVKKINSPWFQLYPDIGNLNGNNLNISEELKKGAGHMIGIHLKDSLPNVFRRVPFGKGTVDFISAFRTLKEIGYSGSFLIEMWNDGSEDALQIIKDAREFILLQMHDNLAQEKERKFLSEQ